MHDGNMAGEDKNWQVDSFVLALMTNSLTDYFSDVKSFPEKTFRKCA